MLAMFLISLFKKIKNKQASCGSPTVTLCARFAEFLYPAHVSLHVVCWDECWPSDLSVCSTPARFCFLFKKRKANVGKEVLLGRPTTDAWCYCCFRVSEKKQQLTFSDRWTKSTAAAAALLRSEAHGTSFSMGHRH
jgi:hypothetical protein